MKFYLRILAIVATGLLATACVSHESSLRESKSALGKGRQVTARGAAVMGMSSMIWGEKWTATNLFERAVAQENTPGNRFNLASGYQATGRVADAVPIYKDVAVTGFNSWAQTGWEEFDPTVKVRRVNLAEESTRRLGLIESAPGYVAQAVPPIVYPDLLVASTNSPEAMPTVGRISDAKAIEFDNAARAAKGR